MGRRRHVLAVHKTEWDRLRGLAGPPDKPPEAAQSDYIKRLIEKSQEWMRTWPDTVQGHVLLVGQMKEKKREKEIALVKAFKELEKRKPDNSEEIQKARQKIFDNSCYGKQLLSALFESKVIEEREAQIIFQKQLKQKAQELEKEQQFMNSLVLASRADEDQIRRKNKEFALINKTMHETKNERLNKEKEKERELERIDARLMKQLLDLEAKKPEACIDKQAIKQHEVDQKKAEEHRAKREKEDDAIATVWRKYYERVRCKEKCVLKQIHHGQSDKKLLKDNYELIEKILEDKKKRYDDFVGKGVNRLEKLISTKEAEDLEKQKQNRQKLLEQVECNKILANTQNMMLLGNKCISDRSSLFTKSHKPQGKKAIAMNEEDHNDSKSFLAPSSKLVDQLKRREQAPTPWTGLQGAHAQFAHNASDALRESRCKNIVRKVIDEYRKANCLNATTLPVSNY